MNRDHRQAAPEVHDLAARLERGELIYYAQCPFPLPQGEDRELLFRQQLAAFGHKNISYNPADSRVSGCVRHDPGDEARLADVLEQFARSVTAWVEKELPLYQGGLRPDRANLHPEEEATRRLRLRARNDLLHIDAFPTRPSHGDRILRVWVNINPTEPRVWVTSEPFATLLARYGPDLGVSEGAERSWLESAARAVGNGLLRLFRPGSAARSVYDTFMLRFHDFLKTHDLFQERAPKQLWSFPPGSAWMAMTDACTHAVLRGRYALEHSYFVSQTVLALPDESPAALLARRRATAHEQVA
jgi:hypothetical protein